MLGTHNSLSYLKVREPWMRLFVPFSKCQSKTLCQQYEAGSRYFDIRFELDPRGTRSAHGLCVYNPTIFTELLQLDIMLKRRVPQKVYIHCVLEHGTDIAKFKRAVNFLKRAFPRFTFVGGYQKKGYLKVLDLPDVDYIVAHAMPTQLIRMPIPKWWAKRLNADIQTKRQSNNIYVIDFI